ncbi:MAG: helix-turn-helix transcriptional regulator [Nitrospira sp.]|nr:helix-turn-helix transcriptional regulator [Nitrospira sp.]
MGDSILKSIRLAQGLPIAAVAVRARVGPGTIIAVERHGHVPTLQTKQKLAKALGVDVSKIWPLGNQSNPRTPA